MFLRREIRSKTQVISCDNDRLSLAVYAEHSPALEPRSDDFSGYRDQLHLCCSAALRKPKSYGPPLSPNIFFTYCFYYIEALKRVAVSCNLVSVRP